MRLSIAMLLLTVFSALGPALGEEMECDLCDKLEELIEATEGLEPAEPIGMIPEIYEGYEPDTLASPELDWSLPDFSLSGEAYNTLEVPMPGGGAVYYQMSAELWNNDKIGLLPPIARTLLIFFRDLVRSAGHLLVVFRFAVSVSRLVRGL